MENTNQKMERESEWKKREEKFRFLFALVILYVLFIIFVEIEFLNRYGFLFLPYIFSLFVIIWVLTYLPFIILPLAIGSLILKLNWKLSIAAIVVVVFIKVLNSVNRHGFGPSEAEFFLHQLKEGSIWIWLSFIGYVYLFYWLLFNPGLAKRVIVYLYRFLRGEVK